MKLLCDCDRGPQDVECFERPMPIFGIFPPWLPTSDRNVVLTVGLLRYARVCTRMSVLCIPASVFLNGSSESVHDLSSGVPKLEAMLGLW